MSYFFPPEYDVSLLIFFLHFFSFSAGAGEEDSEVELFNHTTGELKKNKIKKSLADKVS
jgi:hypothetical protein